LPSPTKRKADVEWAKTLYPNLIRYKPSGNYFGRVRVNGKLIRRSLETHVLTVAKLKLSDFLQDHRRLAVNKGQSVNGEVIIEMFRKEIEDDQNNRPRTKLYKQEVLTALKKWWPGLYCANLFRFLAYSGLRISISNDYLTDLHVAPQQNARWSRGRLCFPT
jgi:hypothetical protein